MEIIRVCRTAAATVESRKTVFTFFLCVYVAGTEFVTNIGTLDSIKNVTKKEFLFSYKLVARI